MPTATGASDPAQHEADFLRHHVEEGGPTLGFAALLGAVIWAALLPYDLAAVDTDGGRLVVTVARVVPAICLAGVGVSQLRREAWLAGRIGRSLVTAESVLIMVAFLATVAVRSSRLGQVDLTAGFIALAVLLFVQIPLWRRSALVGAFLVVFFALAAAKDDPALRPVELASHLLAVGVAGWAGAVHLDRRARSSFGHLLRGRLSNTALSERVAASEALRQVLEHQASIDPLTGLLNRRAFFAGAETDGPEPWSVLVIDADRFKQINDTMGHAAGDAVLADVAGRLGRAVRRGDLLCRLGGEEFAVYLPATDVDTALEVAERIRAAVAAEPCGMPPAACPVTVSVGVAEGTDGEALDGALYRADEAMYAAKRAGGDRTTLSRHDPGPGATVRS